MGALADPFAASPLLRRLAGIDRAGLEAHQLRRVQALCERLYAKSAFYRAKMDAAGLAGGTIDSLDRFTKAFPTSAKADFLADQKEAPPFGTRLGVDRSEVVHISMTSGTSGQGQEIYGRTQRDLHMLGYLHALPWFMAGLRQGDTAINCVPAGGMTTGGWGPGEAIRILGATGFHVGGATSTESKIDLMLKLGGIQFIYASTNYLHTLTEALLARGIVPREAFPDMHGLFIAAEGYPLEWAAKIEEHWGCRLQEGYGSTQLNGFGGSTAAAGVVGQNGARGLIRLFEWEHLIEIVDPVSGLPVAPGEVGEMVVTNLSVEGSPAVRFRTGDAARLVPWQACGGGAWNAIECGTIGRFDDMMKIRGNNIWPSMFDAAVFAHPEIGEYKGRVFTRDGKTEVEVRIAVADHQTGLSDEERARLVGSVRSAIKERSNMWVDVLEVPRTDFQGFAYKARRWVDERQDGYRL
ncbi:phenylacetate--CoA ligase family protein [Sphingomonas jatrophae]|uniref:Phenylacetate-CoA ligase n=1 Tax=Sphingomonas jatrophae TaxID=1166337 RepID=A0A1I6M4V4_9SPHN|nr:phenylacetate--CoA ligase [Sphingomonas jatrophae]SFS10767.1 phenylacetate-CoA ligase [Sphingomonas jatrophae]